MKKVKVLILLFIIILFTFITKTQASAQEIQILKKSDTEYLIYLKDYLKTEFEFAFSNNKNANQNDLKFQICGKDSKNTEVANSIVHINSKTYNQYFSNETYLWVRTISEKNIIESLKIDLSQAVTQNDINLINNVTEIIKVNTKNILTTTYKEDEVNITKTVGKIEILADEETYYKLIKLPNNEQYNQLMKLVEDISSNNSKLDMYSKLTAIKEFKNFFNKSIPKEWQKVENNEILQPEDTEKGEKYILFLKNKKQDGTEKIDAQFLTSTREYNEKYINEKISSKLPITNDNPILYIIISILFVSFCSLIIVKITLSKKLKRE